MGDFVEILFTSDLSTTQWSCSAWDPRTSTNLMTYKGGEACGVHSLSVLKNQFLIAGSSNKPLIHIWPINSQDQVPGIRFVSPGKVNCLALSPDGVFLVAGIQESIYIWEICSGKMLSVLSKHYQSITTIRFTSDGSHFISASQDGSVLVWNLTQVVLEEESNQQPLYSFNDHALAVTDVCLGNGGMRAFMCTVATDRTCRMYDLSSGIMLVTLVFEERLSCVLMNNLETEIYVGSFEGPIYTFSFHSPPRMKEYHISENDNKDKFSGHRGVVACLALSMDGGILASGGEDKNVCLWHVSSRQLLKTLAHHGHVTNVVFLLTSRSIFNPDVRLNLIATNIRRMTEKSSVNSHTVEIGVSEHTEYDTDTTTANSNSHSENSQGVDELRNEIRRLKKVNKELFEYAMKNVLNNK